MCFIFCIIFLFLHGLIGFIPIIISKIEKMDFRTIIKGYTEAPINRHLMLELFKEYQSPNDKISELLKREELISLRRGLYTIGSKIDLPSPGPFLIANHLRGPSYVSLESALDFWNMIPERAYEISSVTTKSSKIYKTPVGRYSYRHLGTPYYSYGLVKLAYLPNQTVLIASREKALCDKIVLTAQINLRSIKQTRDFLLEDLRMDPEVLGSLDSNLIQSWLENAPKKMSLKMLVKTLKDL